MNFRQLVDDFVAMARKRPSLASDPKELDKLERGSIEAWDGCFTALHAPVGSKTWEVGALLLGNATETERIPFELPLPCKVVGLIPSVIATGGNAGTGATVPILDQLDVLIDFNESEIRTNAQGQMRPVGIQNAKDGSYVSLASVGVLAPRLLAWRFEDPSAVLGFKFRAKLGPNVLTDALIRVALVVAPLDD